MLNRFRIFAAAALCLLAAGCANTPPDRWGQIATGTGMVIGATRADAQVAKASAKLAEYCGGLQAAAALGTIFAPEKQRTAATIASAAVNTVCAEPPTDVASALITAAKTYEAVKAAQAGI